MRHKTTDMIFDILMMISLLGTVICLKELRLLGLMTETGIVHKSSGSCLPAIQMALDDIKRQGEILKEYNLTFKWADSKCEPGTALFEMFKHLSEDPPYHMLLGPSCSIAGEATAQVSYKWNLTQLACETSSPTLSDRTRFKRFFRIMMPDQLLNIARVALMNEFNWKRVATVHQAREFFAAITDDFVGRIKGTNISIITQEIVANDPVARVENLVRHDARIILTAMYEDKATEILCAAFNLGLFGPKIVWVFIGWYRSTFWRKHLHLTSCTSEDIKSVTEGAFFVGGVYQNPSDERVMANITASELKYRYLNHPDYDPRYREIEEIIPYLCYDYIWTAALALECSIQTLSDIGHVKSLDQFTYTDGDIGDVIFKCMSDVSFVGVSGKISFEHGSDTEEKVSQIERMQGGGRVNIGTYRQDKSPSYFQWIEGALQWENGIIPTDSSIIQNEEIQLPLAVYETMVALAALGICLSLSFLGFNVMYKNNRHVKMSSPNINNLLLLGCCLCYLTVAFKTFGHGNISVCRARTYCFSLGFTLLFGSLFTKTWRVYRVFVNKNMNRVHIKDRQLFIVIGLLVALILTLLIISGIVGPLKIQYKFFTKDVYETSDGTEVRPFVRVCWSKYSSYFTWALYIIQGALLTFGTFLAWETRHVKVKELNDSQKIGMSLYNVVTLSAVGVLLTLLLEDQEILLYGLTSGFIIVGTTVTQMLIFVPKVRAVIYKIDAEPISTLATSSGNQQSRPAPSHESTHVETISTNN